MQEALSMFDIALEGISPRFAEMGARAFMQGRVATHNPSFRPKPSELAAYCRPLQSSENDRLDRDRHRVLQIEGSGRDEPTEEEKAAVQAKLKEFHRSVADAISMDPVAKSGRNKARNSG